MVCRNPSEHCQPPLWQYVRAMHGSHDGQHLLSFKSACCAELSRLLSVVVYLSVLVVHGAVPWAVILVFALLCGSLHVMQWQLPLMSHKQGRPLTNYNWCF